MQRTIIIGSPGMLTTVQDRGRYGFQRFGMPVTGAADLISMQLANLLVGNDPGLAVLEATLSGPEVRFTGRGLVAFCGGGMRPLLNGAVVPAYRAVEVKEGDRLGFEPSDKGCRGYIAFDGGVDVQQVMGSRSTCLRSGTGGWEGRPLREGETIPLGEKRGKPRVTELPEGLVPGYGTPAMLRILPGPEIRRLAFDGLKNLMNEDYLVGADSDRMGYRLQGEPIRLNEQGHEIISAGIVFGTIQVPPNGQPIVMLADRQTTGGYARIATVATVDHSLLAQLRPGDTVSFCEVSHEEARSLYLNSESFTYFRLPGHNR